MSAFSDYYKPVEPGRGTLVNGQWYVARHGRGTLQMMVSDGVFDDVRRYDDECDHCTDRINRISQLEQHIEALKNQVIELDAIPVELDDEEDEG